MKAYAIYGKEDMRPLELEFPPLEDQALIIKPQAVGICGSDLRQYFQGPSSRYKLPVVLGHELSGEIVEIGSEVGVYTVGDLVTIAPVIPCMRCHACSHGRDNLCELSLITGTSFDGGFAEAMYIPPQMVQAGGVVKVPKGVSYRAAALTELVSCCLHGLRQFKIDIGDKVLIIGDGPIGLVFLQLVMLMGAGYVVTTGRRARRRDLAAELGADEALDANSVNLTEHYSGYFDSVIVATSNIAAAEEAQALVRPGGDLLLFSGYTPGTMMTLDINALHYKELHLHGGVDSTIKDFRNSADILPQLRLDELVSGSWPLDKIVEAFHAAREKDAVKLVIEP